MVKSRSIVFKKGHPKVCRLPAIFEEKPGFLNDEVIGWESDIIFYLQSQLRMVETPQIGKPATKEDRKCFKRDSLEILVRRSFSNKSPECMLGIILEVKMKRKYTFDLFLFIVFEKEHVTEFLEHKWLDYFSCSFGDQARKYIVM
jgi:hypothetical protein